MSEKKILPIVDYRFNATFYPPESTSKEQLPLEQLQEVYPYTDFSSTVYDTPIPNKIIQKNPMYLVPSDISFAKAFLDWQFLQKGAKRKNVLVHAGRFGKTLLFHWRITLPFQFEYLTQDYWFNGPIQIPTHYIDPETEQRMFFEFQSLILTDFSVTINTEQVNLVECGLFGYNPNVVFQDVDAEIVPSFDCWISNLIEVHTIPDDVGLVSNNIIFSMNISQKSSVNFVTYKDEVASQELWYIYIPKGHGKFEQLNGYICLSEHIVDFSTYRWILVQSQPQLDATIEIFDPRYKTTQVNVSKLQVRVKDGETERKLGTIEIYASDFSCQEHRINISGLGRIYKG